MALTAQNTAGDHDIDIYDEATGKSVALIRGTDANAQHLAQILVDGYAKFVADLPF